MLVQTGVPVAPLASTRALMLRRRIDPRGEHVAELVGDTRDEYDDEGPTSSGDLADVDGGTSLEDFAETTGIALRDGGYETVAGYDIALLGQIPETGEQVGVEGGRREVTEFVGTRITRLTLHRDG